MADPKVSVILPFRDAIKNIERSVSSILNQTFPDLELILVNDGSTDGSREIIEQIQDNRIKLINLAASGMVVALNEAIYSTRSKYIALMDSQDVATSDRIEKQYYSMVRNRDSDVLSSKVKYAQESGDRNIRPYIEWTNQILTHEDIYSKRFVNATVLHSTLMFKKDLISKYGLFNDGEFPEDYEILLRWMNQGVKFLKLDEELTVWNDDELRLSRRHIKYSSAASAGLKTKYFNKWFKSYFRTPPDILLWGPGSLTIENIARLEKEGLNIAGFINDNGKSNIPIGEKPVFSKDEIPARIFIIYLVEQFEPGEVPLILAERGMEEGINFIAMS